MENKNVVTTVPLFLNLIVSGGGAGTSDVIDLRECSSLGRFSMTYRVKHADPTKATAGTTSFTPLSSPTRAGVYAAESGTSGTTIGGATGGTGVWEFKPYLTPFMKMRVNVGTSATAGGNSISAELHVQ